jgi:AraC family transcriptional regulator of adaptative response/methylated-DNA-[protein]-cysteine methyltransferase
LETRDPIWIPQNPSSNDDFVAAVMNRDSTFDGRFVFGIRSTGIYCRPSCPARRPKMADGLVFFPTPAEAESEGFRSCRRCKPKEESARSQQAKLVQDVCDYVQSDPSKKLTLAELGQHFDVSPYHLQRMFKELMGLSPRKYVEECRVGQLKMGLSRGDSVADALNKTGYRSQSWLYEDSSAKLGMTPGTYRRGGEGMRIGYLIGACPLGRLIVAATEQGVCAVSMGDNDDKLVANLRREYPSAVIAKSEDVRAFLEGLLRYFDGQQLNLPVDVRGTEFQRRVWSSLQTIPYGTTLSYSAVADAIGEPRAVRAVANACGKNPVPLIIPCHRVVRKDGGLGGYGLGIHRKRELLALEKRVLSEQTR